MKFTIAHRVPSETIYYYKVQAESEEQAIQLIMNGDVECDDVEHAQSFEDEGEYEVQEEYEDDEDYLSGLLYGVDNNQ